MDSFFDAAGAKREIMADNAGNGLPVNSGPGYSAAAVTPSDSTVLVGVRGLYIGSTGDVAVVMAGGGSVTFSAVPTGTILPTRVTKVMSTGTTATLIIALN